MFSKNRCLIAFVFFVISLFLSVSVVEASYSMWTKTYGGKSIDEAVTSLIETSDGGYALTGGKIEELDDAGVSYDIWLVKADANGNMQWNRTYGDTDVKVADESFSLIETFDGGYAIAGRTFTHEGNYFYLVVPPDFLLIKTDSNGNEEWNRTYGGTKFDEAYSLVQTSDGGYAIAGCTRSFGEGDTDFWLVKTDASGNEVWNRTYGGSDQDQAYSLVQTSDGGYAIAGSTMSFGAGDTDFWLVKADANGNMQWNRTYGGSDWDEACSLVQTSDGGYAIGGDARSFGAGRTDFWLVKADANGNMQWNRTYGRTDSDTASSLIKTFDGGYAICGNTYFRAEDAWYGLLVKTDALGNMQWNQTYEETEWLASLVQTSDGGYVIGSYALLNDDPELILADFWLAKTDEYGVIPEFSSWFVLMVISGAIIALAFKKRLTKTIG
jgi:predicted secreted protein